MGLYQKKAHRESVSLFLYHIWHSTLFSRFSWDIAVPPPVIYFKHVGLHKSLFMLMANIEKKMIKLQAPYEDFFTTME